MAKIRVSPTEVQEYLVGLEYPAMKDEIIDYAREQGANEDMGMILERLPDQEYESATALNEEIGKLD